MLDYQDYPCPHCGETTLVYLQGVANAKCESCGEWETDSEEETDGPGT